MVKNSAISKCILGMAAGVIFLSAGFASAAGAPRQGEALLLDNYKRNTARLEASSFGLPLFLESVERGDRVHVDVYGIFAYPFNSIADVLKVPANWCDIVSLHPNVKACTSRDLSGAGLLTFYVGRKIYQTPKSARQVSYRYRTVAQQPGYLDIILSAETGPFSTRDHQMRFEALPLGGKRTFVHVSYEYSDSVALRLAAKTYFATLGRGKVGFTVTGTDKNGLPVYIGGPRGSIERNAVRYYFAIQTFMDTLHYPPNKVFSMRTNKWYDLTSRYRQQLFDLDKKDYLAFKTVEHENQLKLQRQIGTGLQ